MNHTPVSHRLRSNKNIILNSEVQPKITTKAKKRVSFSVSSASNTKTIKPSSSSKSTKPSANVKKIKKPDTLETVEHQTRDATPNNCDSLLVPTSFISNHVVDTEIGKLSTLDTRSKANTYDSTCNMPSTSDNMQHNDTTKLRVTFGTQTDDDNLSWLHTKEILTNKINEQEAEIENLKLQVECLETLLYKPNDQLSQPKSNSKSTPSSISPKFTCHIVGDSHVRGLRDRLSPLLPKGCTSHAFFKPGAGYHEVAQSTKNMFNPSSRDPVVLLCGTNDFLSEPLARLYNRSLQLGIFPDKWKVAFVTPIHKSGKKNDIKNYRPVCNISIIPKIFEKLVHSKIEPQMKSLIIDNQYGFMQKRSTMILSLQSRSGALMKLEYCKMPSYLVPY
ncbi:hypothetical protein M8J77_008505 [Diaphorina citri]|nr:hypothetical protein M8J77_008505 [Diaphorina citri]